MLKLSDRFWSKVDKSAGPDACWPWTAGKFPKGYGAFQLAARKTVRAHRRALQLSGVTVPAGASVLHSCDNPPCCNPRHLRVGDAAQNQADAVSRDRHSRGSRNGIAKLTEDQAVEARRRVAGGESQASVARDFGVTHGTVNHIITRRNWRHV